MNRSLIRPLHTHSFLFLTSCPSSTCPPSICMSVIWIDVYAKTSLCGLAQRAWAHVHAALVLVKWIWNQRATVEVWFTLRLTSLHTDTTTTNHTPAFIKQEPTKHTNKFLLKQNKEKLPDTSLSTRTCSTRVLWRTPSNHLVVMTSFVQQWSRVEAWF